MQVFLEFLMKCKKLRKNLEKYNQVFSGESSQNKFEIKSILIQHSLGKLQLKMSSENTTFAT